MNKILMILSAVLALYGFKANASDSCEILFNKQVIFKGNVDQENSVGLLKVKQLKNKDFITIRYHSETENKGWKRTFYINGLNDQTLKTVELLKQNGAVTVSASVLAELKEKNQAFSIYTVSLPADKAMAARIRVRRMFICKIEWN